MVEQSKLTSIHLLGFILNDMAYSMPFIRYWFSGQMNELPAYAASTCNQTPISWHTGPITKRYDTVCENQSKSIILHFASEASCILFLSRKFNKACTQKACTQKSLRSKSHTLNFGFEIENFQTLWKLQLIFMS